MLLPYKIIVASFKEFYTTGDITLNPSNKTLKKPIDDEPYALQVSCLFR